MAAARVRRRAAVRRGGLDERLAAAFADADGGPALLIGMDTPQLTPRLLDRGLGGRRRLVRRRPPTAASGRSGCGTGCRPGARRADVHGGHRCAQRARLHAAGLRVAELPRLRDVDTAADAVAVARQAPRSRFAARAREFAPVLGLADAAPSGRRRARTGMKAGAIGLYEEALSMSDAGLLLRTACGRALPLQVERWCGPPDAGRRGAAAPLPGAGTRHRLRSRAPDHRAGRARDPRARRGHLPYRRGPRAPGRGVRRCAVRSSIRCPARAGG